MPHILRGFAPVDLKQEEDGGMEKHEVRENMTPGGIIVPGDFLAPKDKPLPPDPFADIKLKLGKGKLTAEDIKRVDPAFCRSLNEYQQHLFRQDMEAASENPDVCRALGNDVHRGRELEKNKAKKDKAKKKAARKRSRK